MSSDTPTDTPAEAPIDTPVEAPVDAPIDAPVDAPVAAPIDAPVHAPVDAPVDPPIDAPVDTPPDAANEAPAAGAAGGTPVSAPLSPQACAELLRQHFPALFASAPKPLKLRIQADIQARAPGVFSKAALSGFLRQHTARHAYLLALTRAGQRFDLDGQPAGELSAEHRQAAQDELARRRGLREEREAVLHEQRRNRAALLRAFDSSTLTVANFCALKGLAEEELEGLLERARAEAREAREAPPPRAPLPGRDRAPTRPQPGPRRTRTRRDE